jgi:hypothetical protein
MPCPRDKDASWGYGRCFPLESKAQSGAQKSHWAVRFLGFQFRHLTSSIQGRSKHGTNDSKEVLFLPGFAEKQGEGCLPVARAATIKKQLRFPASQEGFELGKSAA